MKSIMNIDQLKAISEVEAFLDGSQPVMFGVASSKDERYVWVHRTLVKFSYRQLKRSEKGILIRFICKVGGYSRQQITRLIKQYMESGKIVRRQKTTNGFKRHYTDEDIRYLAKVDELHEAPNGAAIKKFASVPIVFMERRITSALAEFRCRICITCASRKAIYDNGVFLIKQNHGHLLLAFVANQRHKVRLVIFVLTQSIRAI